MNYNFHLLNKTQRINSYVTKLLVNYPKSSVVLKNNIEKTMYDMMECIFSYNINDVVRIRQKFLKDFLVKLAMFDYYAHVSYENKFITKRHYEVIGRSILEIKKISFGLLKSDKESEV